MKSGKNLKITLVVGVVFAILLTAGCAPSMSKEAAEEIVAEVEETSEAPAATQAPQPSPTRQAADNVPTDQAPSDEIPEEIVTEEAVVVEEEEEAAEEEEAQPTESLANEYAAVPDLLPEKRTISLEWPEEMWLKESDVIILSLIPEGDSFVLEAEFSDHSQTSEPISIPQLEGALIWVKAWLDAPGFNYSPQEAQQYQMHAGQPITWRWSLVPENSGRQRINITTQLIIDPPAGVNASQIEHILLSQSLEIQVKSILGLPRRTANIMLVLLLTLFISGITLYFVSRLIFKSKTAIQNLTPDSSVVIEPLPGKALDPITQKLMQAMFKGYERIIIMSEFQSGYSGARTWLVMPIHQDGRHDAQTIVKVGEQSIILDEYENYENFVKNTLPPMTARIQGQPASLKGDRSAAIRYTFIGLSGQTPHSLRQTLLERPDPIFLQRLFETFGPTWWLQRNPATFRLGTVYDTILPSHLVISPAEGKGMILDGRRPVDLSSIKVGDVLSIRHFPITERRADGQSFSLENKPQPGTAPLRIRWMSPQLRESITGRVIATRWTILQDAVEGKPLYGLPDPLADLAQLMQITVHDSRSIVHGDLNLENILVGPGELVWLIDFARTRKDSPLVDFTHLYGEIVAQVIAPKESNPEKYLTTLKRNAYPLLKTVDEMALKLLPDQTQRQAYDLPLIITCLGMLKFPNLNPHARHLLYLTAAWKNHQRREKSVSKKN